MWCYQKPDYEALLLAELQRQQQCSQFCDTLLKTEGVSVPAHSCILSAISPQMSSSLSAMPQPPAGQSRLLEFQALGASTLLQIVRLLYSGKMVGQGEEERHEAVSAAARLGIHGLVEVIRGISGAAESRHKEVGVQTEPMILGENRGRRGWWSREERDGVTFLRRGSEGQKDAWAQTEEPQVNTNPPLHQAVSYETIDVGALQTLGSLDLHQIQTQFSYIPVSHVYPPNENQGEATSGADPRSWWCTSQDNISGFTSYSQNPPRREGRRRGRPRGSRAVGTRSARRTRSEARGASRPRASTGGRGRGRGRGGITQTVDVQTVGVGKIQKMFLQRWGVRTPRTGQGGGAVGRMLCLKTREILKTTKSCTRRRRAQKWDFGQSGDLGERGGGQLRQSDLPAQRERITPTSASFSSPPVCFYNVHHTLPASSPALQPSLSSPADLHQHPAPSLHHITSLPSPNPPPNEPEHIDRLLEEVMMGLNILPNQTKHQESTTVLVERGSRHVGGGGGGGGSSSGSAVPVLQQQGEGELHDMLENFLQSFEQHLHSCSTTEETEKDGQSSADAALNKHKRRTNKADTVQSSSQPRRSPAVPQKPTETATRVKVRPKRPRKRRKNQYLFTMERKRVRKRVSSSKAKDKTVPDRGDRQLQQMPVVKLERSGPLPARVTLQGLSCQSQEEGPLITKSSSLPETDTNGGWTRKVYPIRSRFREAHITDSMPFLHEPLLTKQQQTADKPCSRQSRSRNNGQLHGVCNGESSVSPVQQQQQQHPPVDEQEENQEQHEEGETNVQPHGKAKGLRATGEKRGAESDEETSEDTNEAKRLCLEQPTQGETSVSAESATTERPQSTENLNPGSTGSCEGDIDEDIDVIGGSSPVPDPVIISWSMSSEDEEEEEGEPDEDIDIIGDKTNYGPSAFSTAVKDEHENNSLRSSLTLV
ncbi:uncharacterized protein LOC117817857 isoform X1 [Xyrichtys novacula]|uniref:Uncharacterized protein LOC117817857 isoform X1 n=1 Tax=Xyrichtys novacula TaxID=13765 RepID=A0AAV1FDH8_XYRNO|nr:uncharacterized protein LOC117817857 isoform X1 [Xyrichtys novacula]